MRKLALLFAVVLVVAACGDVDQADRDAIAVAEAAATATTTAAPAVDHVDDDDEADHGDDDLAVEEDHDDAVEADHDDDEEDHADDDNAAEADRSVEVILAEFAFDPDAFEVTAGETVEFVVTNTGFVEHEFRLSNGHRIDEHLAAGHEDHDEDMDDMGGHHEEGGDYILLVQPGETGSITITFDGDPSLYTEVACLIPGHYEAGMYTPLNYS